MIIHVANNKITIALSSLDIVEFMGEPKRYNYAFLNLGELIQKIWLIINIVKSNSFSAL